jgi:hypothetical protein
MDTSFLTTKFARIGARLKPADRTNPPMRSTGVLALDVRTDRLGEFFQIASRTDPAVEVLDVQPATRHLLLLVRDGAAKDKLLCGHDERHWFVAGVPEAAPVGTVRQAMEALKPVEVRAAQVGLRAADRTRRKNAAFVRQGEWFFLPEPDYAADDRLVLRWEPMRRNTGGKPHWAEFLVRSGGELVYVCRKYRNGVTESTYRRILATTPSAKAWGWVPMRRNPGVYVRGRVRHADHATIHLPGWHRVVMNTEGQSRAMRNVAFLD